MKCTSLLRNGIRATWRHMGAALDEVADPHQPLRAACRKLRRAESPRTNVCPPPPPLPPPPGLPRSVPPRGQRTVGRAIVALDVWEVRRARRNRSTADRRSLIRACTVISLFFFFFFFFFLLFSTLSPAVIAATRATLWPFFSSGISARHNVVSTGRQHGTNPTPADGMRARSPRTILIFRRHRAARRRRHGASLGVP